MEGRPGYTLLPGKTLTMLRSVCHAFSETSNLAKQKNLENNAKIFAFLAQYSAICVFPLSDTLQRHNLYESVLSQKKRNLDQSELIAGFYQKLSDFPMNSRLPKLSK